MTFKKCFVCNNSNKNSAKIILLCPKWWKVKGEFICEDHFEGDQIVRHGKRYHFKPDAVPLLPEGCYFSSANSPHNDKIKLKDEASQSLNVDGSGENTSGLIQEKEKINQEESDSQGSAQPDSQADSQGSNQTDSLHSDFIPSSGEFEKADVDVLQGEEDSENDSDGMESAYVLVNWPELRELLCKCSKDGCSAFVSPDNLELSRRGAQLNCTRTCDDNHVTYWSSSPNVSTSKRSIPVINLLLSIWILLSGLHFDKISKFCHNAGVMIHGKTSYYSHLKTYIYPCVWSFWEESQRTNLEEVKERQQKGEDINCAGDGRFDSPGFCAMFCTYFVECLNTNKIIGVYVAVKGQVKSSGAMETASCKTLLTFLLDQGIKIKHFVTDRSSSIRNMMLVEFPKILHQFDPWHFVKNIKKAMWKAGKLAGCAILRDWIPSVGNAIWMALSSSIGNTPRAREVILSIPSHCSGHHQFPEFEHYKTCAHETRSEEEEAKKDYIPQGSKALNKLTEILHGTQKTNLDDLEKMDAFLHTGAIESLNSMATIKYMSKTYSYSWLSMWIRSVLGAMDHNFSVGRKQAKTKSGTPRYQLSCDRGGHSWTIKPIHTKKSDNWKHDISDGVLLCAMKGQVPNVIYPIYEVGEKPVPPMSKEDYIKKHQTRGKGVSAQQ